MKRQQLQRKTQLFFLTVAILSVFFVACGVEPTRAPGEDVKAKEAIGTTSQALHTRRKVVSFKYTDTGSDLPHGIAGSKRYVFVTRPLVGRISVHSRVTGRFIQDLPAPSGGFLLPFTLRIPSPGKLVILDSGGFPSATGFATPIIHTYSFGRNAQGQFTAQLQKTLTLNTIVVGFSEDVEVLANGDMVLSDSVLGALWLIKSDDTVVPAITPASLAPQDAIPALAGCLFPPGQTVGSVPFEPIGGFAPGVGSMGSRNGILYFSGSCLGGIRTIAVSHFYDNRQPHERAADIQVLSPRPANVAAETLKGLAFNRFNPSDTRLYVSDPLRLSILRINTTTGAREHLAQNERLFNFTIAMSFLPPLFPGVYTMVLSSDQEHRFTGINGALTEDIFQTPFLLTKTIVLR